MNLTIRILGAEVLGISTDKPKPDDDPDSWRGDIATTHTVGFQVSTPLPVREPGRDLE